MCSSDLSTTAHPSGKPGRQFRLRDTRETVATHVRHQQPSRRGTKQPTRSCLRRPVEPPAVTRVWKRLNLFVDSSLWSSTAWRTTATSGIQPPGRPSVSVPKAHNVIAVGNALIVPHIFVDTSESDSVLNNSLVPNSLVTKHSFVLAHLQTRRRLRSVLHFGHGRKWHEIGQANYGQANESQEHRWLKNHRNPIYDRSIFRLRCVVR